MAFDRMKALETYLESCSTLETFAEILEQQCVQLTKELQNLTSLDFEEGAPLLAMVQQNRLWTKPQKETMSQAIHKKVQESMVSKGVVKERVQHQSFIWFPQFLCKSDWDLLMTATIPTAQKSSVVMDRLWKLDLRAPNEDTFAMITVTLLLNETERFSDPVQLRSSYLSVKGLVKAYLKNRLKNVQPTWTYKDLPPVVAALEQERVANTYAEGEKPASLPSGITMEYMMYWMNVVPQRSNSSSISISLPKAGAFQGQNMFGGMMMGHHAMMPMGFQQVPTMPSGMFQVPLPSPPQAAAPLMALPGPGQLALPAPALPSPAVAAPAAKASAVTALAVTAAAVTAPAETQEIEIVAPIAKTPVKRPLALTDGTVEDDPKTKAPGEGTSAVQVSLELEKALSARDAVKKDNKAKQEDDNENAKKKEEPQPCWKRPAANTPASKSKMKRPASASSVVSSAPAGSQKKVKQEKKEKTKSGTNDGKSGGHCKGPITRKQRLKLRPEGCSSCRYVAGCCDSCWIKRKYRPV